MSTRKSYPLKHISIRVPWHDDGWRGTVCKAPKLNDACLKLKRIALNRNDEAEEAVAGKSIADLPEGQWPCCLPERAAFMAPFEFTRLANHPYSESSPETHGHFLPTLLRQPEYAAPAVPFRWMFKNDLDVNGNEYQLNVDEEKEPYLPFDSNWIQDIRNQRPLLDCFFDHVRKDESLCFFYAKRVPFVEDFGRIIVGVGRVKHIGQPVEYKHDGRGALRCMLWERMVQHSIRPNFKDGFLLPYHQALELAATDPSFNPAEIAASAPPDRIDEFSYGSEHVTHDGAIAALLACAASLQKAEDFGIAGPWSQCIRWTNDRLAELWKMRGPCPGLGAALYAFGINLGTLVAGEIAAKLGENEDPWPLVDKVLRSPKKHLPPHLLPQVGETLSETWKALAKERRALLQLLSRFEISQEQAKTLYNTADRKKAGIDCTDKSLLENPYLIFELTRETDEPVSVWTVDRAVFPVPAVRDKHPLPKPSALDSGTDKRRIRAFAVEVLEEAAADGDTLLPQDDLIVRMDELPLDPPCSVNQDILKVAEKGFSSAIDFARMCDESQAYQLTRLATMGALIREKIKNRIGGRRNTVEENWENLLSRHLNVPVKDETEKTAREEKAAALKELAESRLSVLIGPAGTGKTTLLSILCSQKDIAAGDVLLLAPTGKARVRMENAVRGLKLKAYTLAQFLTRCDRYDWYTQKYRLSDQPPADTARTVIVDEASMLTEEMLAALLDALKGVHRLILVGDPQQLPPIGPGRPFVDIVTELKPKNIDSTFPKVGQGYAELTIRRRQAGQERKDLQLAEWFSGRPLGAGEDDVFDTVVREGSEHIQFVQWETPEEFERSLLDVLVKELKLKDAHDEQGFDLSLGAVIKDGYSYFNRNRSENAIEAWQVLSPVRGSTHGVTQVNRLIHKIFRAGKVEFASRRKYRKIPKPMGGEEIVYGDKVINLRNHKRDKDRKGWSKVYPDDAGAARYIANGEIGIAVGQFRTPQMTKPPRKLNIAFSSQPGYKYDFFDWEFGDEGEPPLELAYVLTVHKAQGSEFNKVILVLPNPCWLLSRELLYTALTRQLDRVVVLHQGSRSELKPYASDAYSETANRLTNLFTNPDPVPVQGRFLERRLINCTCDGTLVRSKSEVIVYDRLKNAGITPSYEKPLKIGNVTKYPDFTIEDDDTGEIYYWEHLGMMSDPGYKRRWEAKLKWYRQNKILPHEEGGGENGILIITKDNEKQGISSKEIDRVINSTIKK